jgi:hypothetical protein
MLDFSRHSTHCHCLVDGLVMLVWKTVSLASYIFLHVVGHTCATCTHHLIFFYDVIVQRCSVVGFGEFRGRVVSSSAVYVPRIFVLVACFGFRFFVHGKGSIRVKWVFFRQGLLRFSIRRCKQKVISFRQLLLDVLLNWQFTLHCVNLDNIFFFLRAHRLFLWHPLSKFNFTALITVFFLQISAAYLIKWLLKSLILINLSLLVDLQIIFIILYIFSKLFLSVLGCDFLNSVITTILRII